MIFHGIATPINIISEDTIFNGCPKTFTVGRYHSWVINNNQLPTEFQITATDEQGNIMALKHRTHDYPWRSISSRIYFIRIR